MVRKLKAVYQGGVPRRMPNLKMESPTRNFKRRSPSHSKAPDAKRQKTDCSSMTLQRAKEPIAQPWPTRDLNVCDAPLEIGDPLMKDVLVARGWHYSDKPCKAIWNEKIDDTLIWVKEFEASVRGESPQKAFGKKQCVQEGYRLKKKKLPSRMLWMLGRMPFRSPGGRSQYYRDDFVQTVVDYGENLPGEPGNYRICKIPGTENAVSKTNLTIAFEGKSWYPETFILPKEKDAFLRKLRADGEKGYWIGKPRNDYGGKGISVWKGSDLELIKLGRESESYPQQVVQRYIADPLLIGGYKFHMRIHLLISSLNPLQAFVQENGQCLFATKPYTLSSKTLGADFDPPAHVTNLCLNATPENKDNFLRAKPVIGKGQQLRMKEFMQYMSANYPSFSKHKLFQQILEIARDFTKYIAKSPSVKRHGKLIPDRHFEIFGMDLMMDKNLKVWMCEVNNDPGLAYPDEEVLGSPNPDYKKELQACDDTLHDMFTLLGLDARKNQSKRKGSLKHWFCVDFSGDD